MPAAPCTGLNHRVTLENLRGSTMQLTSEPAKSLEKKLLTSVFWLIMAFSLLYGASSIAPDGVNPDRAPIRSVSFFYARLTGARRHLTRLICLSGVLHSLTHAGCRSRRVPDSHGNRQTLWIFYAIELVFKYKGAEISPAF